MSAGMIAVTDSLKDKAENLVYQIGQGMDQKTLHGLALDVLLGLIDLKKGMEASTEYSLDELCKSYQKEEGGINPEIEKKEIDKVASRLPRWAKNPDQINSRILTAFLQLQKKGVNPIDEKNLKDEYVHGGGDESKFYKNYPQMKSISSRNHGKVFEENKGVIELWEHIKDAVEAYKAVVFSEE